MEKHGIAYCARRNKRGTPFCHSHCCHHVSVGHFPKCETTAGCHRTAIKQSAVSSAALLSGMVCIRLTKISRYDAAICRRRYSLGV